MDPRVETVIEFWFGTEPEPTPATFRRWFTKNPAFDDEVRSRFGTLHEEAAAGRLASWRGAARPELALLVVLDQFSRNLFRDDPRAFAQDPLALPIARELRDSGRARELGYHERMVALLPLQHAEDRAIQAESVTAFEALLGEARAGGASASVIGSLAGGLDYARQHAAIVERFGRFPHRNKVLGRTSTAEELAFLEQPGSSF
jgi:uncharacterized protein (DUF924 family)